jgi:hypothetical protein
MIANNFNFITMEEHRQTATLQYGELPYMTDMIVADEIIFQSPDDPDQAYLKLPAGTVLRLNGISTHGPIVLTINGTIEIGLASKQFPKNGIKIEG